MNIGAIRETLDVGGKSKAWLRHNAKIKRGNACSSWLI
jgi:hypothetical protein